MAFEIGAGRSGNRRLSQSGAHALFYNLDSQGKSVALPPEPLMVNPPPLGTAFTVLADANTELDAGDDIALLAGKVERVHLRFSLPWLCPR